MKNKQSDPEKELREVMLRHILQGEFAAQVEDDAINLASNDGWWWREQTAREPQVGQGMNSEEAVPLLNRLSTRIVRGADWLLLAARHLALGLGDVGTTKGAEAATMKGPAKAPHDYRSWKQGDMCLTLSVAKPLPFTVTLHIDEGPVVNVTHLVWVDMDSIESDPLQRPVLHCFDLEPTSDERTFTVETKPAEVVRRLSAIMAVEKNGTSDARLLLPFVEWD